MEVLSTLVVYSFVSFKSSRYSRLNRHTTHSEHSVHDQNVYAHIEQPSTHTITHLVRTPGYCVTTHRVARSESLRAHAHRPIHTPRTHAHTRPHTIPPAHPHDPAHLIKYTLHRTSHITNAYPLLPHMHAPLPLPPTSSTYPPSPPHPLTAIPHTPHVEALQAGEVLDGLNQARRPRLANVVFTAAPCSGQPARGYMRCDTPSSKGLVQPD